MSYNMSSTIIIGKIIAWICQKISRTEATAFPGLICLKLNPALINQSRLKNKLHSIIITGTNGKTTTASLLGKVFQQQGISYIQNRFGSNLLRGIASTLINQSNYKGEINKSWGIWEVDEAAVISAVKNLQPEILIFTNLSRDQLDRYGEADKILSDWKQAVKRLPPGAIVVTNLRLAESLPKIRKTYTFAESAAADYHLNHLVIVRIISQLLNFNPAGVSRAFKYFRPVFGREEEVYLNGRKAKIILVKNPAGFNAVLAKLKTDKLINKYLLIILNDFIADGTDVSWIYDVNFNYLKSRQAPVIVSGTRYLDMALRLKYAGIPTAKIIPIDSIQKALTYKPEIILPTYTAMLKLRQILFKSKFN